ncbi:MAG: efflux RND transporter periplasmic adaptor subunit [Puniceicoccaceae bacterium]|nr:MAG: efflux RND transporter periplasmic adaptor subunit [Puniceicoccaceae bacterium]
MKTIGLILTLVGIGLAVWHFTFHTDSSSASTSAAQLDFTEVDRGPIMQSVRATGRLGPVAEVQVGSQVSGIITELFADFNSEVVAGQLIAQLDPSTFEAEVALAEAELQSAEAGLELARSRERRVRPLFQQEHLPQSALDEAIAELRQAEAQVSIRESRLRRAKVELERCRIVSPTNGIVISRNVDVGQKVAASLSAPVLFEIADDLTRMEIIANVPEADIGQLREGQSVEFLVDAYRESRFEGQVVQIRNAPRIIDSVVTYDTVVRVDNSELLLKPGMTAEVFIITEQADDAVRVRNSALRARLPENLRPSTERPETVSESARPVFVLGDTSSVEVRWIETGITDGFHTEVRSGLESGMQLITGFRLSADRSANRSGSVLTGQQATF